MDFQYYESAISAWKINGDLPSPTAELCLLAAYHICEARAKKEASEGKQQFLQKCCNGFDAAALNHKIPLLKFVFGTMLNDEIIGGTYSAPPIRYRVHFLVQRSSLSRKMATIYDILELSRDSLMLSFDVHLARLVS